VGEQAEGLYRKELVLTQYSQVSQIFCEGPVIILFSRLLPATIHRFLLMGNSLKCGRILYFVFACMMKCRYLLV
jgi:hypothetical protein